MSIPALDKWDSFCLSSVLSSSRVVHLRVRPAEPVGQDRLLRPCSLAGLPEPPVQCPAVLWLCWLVKGTGSVLCTIPGRDVV